MEEKIWLNINRQVLMNNIEKYCNFLFCRVICLDILIKFQ